LPPWQITPQLCLFWHAGAAANRAEGPRITALDFADRLILINQSEIQTQYNRSIMSQNITSPDAEFASAEEAEAYDQWLRAKIAASLADSRPAIPHHIAMAQLRAVIDRQPDQDASDPVAP
jgi:hypothetical protein